MFVSETYDIIDGIYYNPTGSTVTSTSTSDRKVNTDFDNVNIPLNSDFEYSYDYISSSIGFRWYIYSSSRASASYPEYALGFGANTQAGKGYHLFSTIRITSPDNIYLFEATSNTKYHVRIVKTGTTIQVYVDDTLYTTHTVSWWDNYSPFKFGWNIWKTGTATVDNILIKPL